MKQFLIGLLVGLMAFPLQANRVRPPKINPEDIKQVLEFDKGSPNRGPLDQAFSKDLAQIESLAIPDSARFDILVYRQFLDTSLEAEFKYRLITGYRLGLKTAAAIAASPFPLPGLKEKAEIYNRALKENFYSEKEMFQVFLEASILISKAKDQLQRLDYEHHENRRKENSPEVRARQEEIKMESAYYISKLDEFFDSEPIYTLLLNPTLYLGHNIPLAQKIRDEFGTQSLMVLDPVKTFQILYETNWALIQKHANQVLKNQLEILKRSQEHLQARSIIDAVTVTNLIDNKFFLRHDLMVAKLLAQLPPEKQTSYKSILREKLKAAGIVISPRSWARAVLEEGPFYASYIIHPVLGVAADTSRSAFNYWTRSEMRWALVTGMGTGLTSFRAGSAAEKMAVELELGIDVMTIMSSALILGAVHGSVANRIGNVKASLGGALNENMTREVGVATLARLRTELSAEAFAATTQRLKFRTNLMIASRNLQSRFLHTVVHPLERPDVFLRTMGALGPEVIGKTLQTGATLLKRTTSIWGHSPKTKKSIIMGLASGTSDFIGTGLLTAWFHDQQWWEPFFDPKMVPRLWTNLMASGLLSFFSVGGMPLRKLMIFNGIFISSLYYIFEKVENDGIDPDVAMLNLWFSMFISTTKAKRIFDPLAVRMETNVLHTLAARGMPKTGLAIGFLSALGVYIVSNVGGSMTYNMLDDNLMAFPVLYEKVQKAIETGELPEDFKAPSFVSPSSNPNPPQPN